MDDEAVLTPLRLCTTDELIEELKSRFDAVLVMTLDIEAGVEHCRYYKRGSIYTAMGMARQFEQEALDGFPGNNCNKQDTVDE